VVQTALKQPPKGLRLWLTSLFARASRGPARPAHPIPAGATAPLTRPAAPQGIVGYARFTSLEIREAAPLSKVGQAHCESIAAQVVAHFDEHRPGPQSQPTLSLRILELLGKPNLDERDLLQMVSQDGAVAAAVLKLANSAAFRGGMEIDSLRDAIARLGFREVGNVAGAVAARTLFAPESRAGLVMFKPRFHSQFLDAATVAVGAASLAIQKRVGRSDRAFLAGMLHDIGKSVGLKSLASLVTSGQVAEGITDQMVARVLERVHVQIGGDLHKQWALPAFLTAACVRHHDPIVETDPELVEVHLVRVASGLRQLRNAPEVPPTLPLEIEQSMLALGLTPFEFRALDTELTEVAERLGPTLAG
jgi:HD-like signal output (HDOD) protein